MVSGPSRSELRDGVALECVDELGATLQPPAAWREGALAMMPTTATPAHSFPTSGSTARPLLLQPSSMRPPSKGAGSGGRAVEFVGNRTADPCRLPSVRIPHVR